MFDWFREVGEELGGIDSMEAKKERLERKESERVNKFIISRRMKFFIISMGVLYIVMAGSTVKTFFNAANIFLMIKYIVMMIDAVIVIFALIFGKQKGELVALVGIFLFLLLLFLSIIIL